MAFTQSQLDALEDAIGSGSLIVEFDGKRVQYRSLDDMMRIRETIRGAIGVSSGRARFSLAGFTKDSSQPTRTTVDPFNINS